MEEHAYELRQFCGSDPLKTVERYYATHDQDWEGGIENGGLDISQLESYINDDNNDNICFSELQGVSEHQGHSRDAVNRLHQQQQQQQQQQHLQYITNNQLQHNWHHLPDSPPDSGSEQPYSPPDQPNLSPHQKLCDLSDIYPQGGVNGSPVINVGYNGSLPPSHPHHQAYPAPSHQLQSIPGLQTYPTTYHQGIPPLPIGSQTSQSIYLGGSPSPNGAPNNPVKKRKMNDTRDGPLPSSHNNSNVNIKQEPETNSTGSGCNNVINRTPSSGIPAPNDSTSIPPTPGVSSNGVLPGSNKPVVISYPGLGEEEEYTMDSTGGTNPAGYVDNSFQCIKFHLFQQQNWCTLYDEQLKELSQPLFQVDADKGFNYSNPDEAFVCQKKNHFQVTSHAQVDGNPKYIKSQDGFQAIDSFSIQFFGVKTESPNQRIRIEQSQSDRSKKPFHPVPVDLKNNQLNKLTIGRMHFSETTSNNMRKKGKPNPDQRYFYLVVSLEAHCGDRSFPIISQATEKIIVRASNPGQFESDVEYTFQRGSYPESIYHMGRVGVNTDKPDEALVVHGNLKLAGQLLQPSDKRAKESIKEIDTSEQLKNVQNIRVVKYEYKEEFSKTAGLVGPEKMDVGVIAQEVKTVIPDAVKETGDFTLSNGDKIKNLLLVNKERIFFENVGAVKELCKVTDKLENRIDKLEQTNTSTKLNRFESFKSTSSVSTKTSGTSRISSVNYTRHRSSRLRSRLGDEGICSNKILQLITITIVCIMMICLLSLAIHYFIDYYDRKTDTPSTTSSYFWSSTSDTSPNTTDLSSSLSSSVTTSGGLPSSSTSHHTSVILSTTSSYPTTITTPGFVRPPVLGKPKYCDYTSSRILCQVYCCRKELFIVAAETLSSNSSGNENTTDALSSRYSFSGTSSSSPFSRDIDFNLISNRYSTDGANTVSMSSIPHPTRFKSMPIKKSVPVEQQIRLAWYRARAQLPSSKNIKKTISKRSVISRRSINFASNRTASPNQLSVGIVTEPEITILDLNETITNLYCIYQNSTDHLIQTCGESSQLNNITYGVPLSMYMPHSNLTLKFRFTSSNRAENIRFCPSCDGCTTEELSENQQCPDSSEHNPEGGVEPSVDGLEYKVLLRDIGSWSKISYRFRILLVPEFPISQLCSLSSDKLGIFYNEINLLFHRVCDE